MSDDYTPVTDEVREIYVGWRAHLRRLMGTPPVPVDADYRDFARWLNRALADAWDEGFTAGVNTDLGDWEHPPDEYTNPHREDNRHG